ncbi:MAG: antibiotic biosynthesis monooxygenase [Haliscomenobacter sp.]|nr:antibiotic biosynthesis monooxygenase [Haliscomenobacter sp.]MBK8655894.1 antibiotic biosynthesis monooxygenase [Haliscomenobacter sp.]MBP9075587.1 antibiotic biosynthesis monooxygenase [Haliscomenobacter sp.]MBP9872456.1 antibiotic biosynthesis monooxygenase [Haliscomenobacter sp.]
MIRRIVKMTFREEETDTFLDLFERTKNAIRNFPGCCHLELWRQHAHEHVFFTYSLWENPGALEAYRQSELFQNTWSQTKALFAAKPQAWSLELVSQPDLQEGQSDF